MGLHNSFEIWQLYGVNRSLLHKWNCRYYRYRILSTQTYFTMNPKKQSDKARIKELEAENKRLRAAYEDEKLASYMYKKMIQVAEKMFDIRIEKKPGAKQ